MAEPVDNDSDQEFELPDLTFAEIDSAEAEETPSEPAEQAKDDGADTEENPEPKEEESEGEQQPAEEQAAEEDPAEQQRRHNAEMARQRIQNRERNQQEIAQKLDEKYGPKTEDQLIEEGLTPEQAQIQALREEMAYERQKTHVAQINAGMQADAVNVMNDFPVFNPDSNDYDPEFAKLVEQQYQTAARLRFDDEDKSLVLNAEVPLYDFYQQMATIYNRGATRGTQQAQKSVMKTLSRTESVGGSPSSTRDDSLEALEERIGDMPLV
jgi:hypothetical protein